MGVLVCYDDFTYDVVNDYHLDFLIDTGCIIGFDKSGNWTKVGEEREDAAASLPQQHPPHKDYSF